MAIIINNNIIYNKKNINKNKEKKMSKKKPLFLK